jgi:hypothetical protein
MRTDGVALSEAAVQQLRAVAAETFDATHVPADPRVYKSKAKNAQVRGLTRPWVTRRYELAEWRYELAGWR